jgi:hypothetical protein
MAYQKPKQAVCIQPVGLGASTTSLDFNTGGINHAVVDSMMDEIAVEPKAIPPSLVAAHNRSRRG